MATTKIKNLPTVSLSQVATNNNFFLYMSDLTNFRDVKFQARDFFTSITSLGTGASLIARSSFNAVSLKTLGSSSQTLNVQDGPTGLEISLRETYIDLNLCDNTNSSFLKTVDLTTSVGTSILSIINGGTGSNDQATALNLITNSGSGTINQVLKTDGTNASWDAVNSLVTAGIGLTWDTSTTPYTLNADWSALTLGADAVINNNVTISGSYNLAIGTGWLSNDKTNEGINIDSTGRVFMGPSTPTAVFDSTASAALTLGDNLSFISGATRSINMVSPAAGAGNEFQILGSAPAASNQDGGAVTLKGGIGSGSGAGGSVNLYAGDSTSGDGDINIYVTDAGTVAQVMKIHGSNKHFTIGSTGVNNGAVLDIQNDTSGAACLELDQNDTDEPFIVFTGSSAADSTANVSSSSGTSAAKNGAIRLNINGSDVWVRTYASAV